MPPQFVLGRAELNELTSQVPSNSKFMLLSPERDKRNLLSYRLRNKCRFDTSVFLLGGRLLDTVGCCGSSWVHRDEAKDIVKNTKFQLKHYFIFKSNLNRNKGF